MKRNATTDEMIAAIKADPKVGVGTCTHIDECFDRADLVELIEGATTTAEAVAKAHEFEGLKLEQALDARWGDDDDPQLAAWREWNGG